MTEIRLVVLHPDERYCEQIIEAFHRYDPEMVLEAVPDLREATRKVKEEQPAVAVVGVDSPNDPALKAIEAISALPGETGIIVISKEPTQELLVSCMRAGSDEFLEFPIDGDELAKALQGLLKRKGIVSAEQGKVVAIFSAAGGVGVTTIACNVAAGIAAELGTPNACCIVDMNFQFGAVALVMDIREFSHSVADAAHDHERLDENLLNSYVSRHSSGAAVLPAPLNVAELEAVDPWQLRGVVQMCRKSFQHVILDMPHLVDDSSVVGLDEADEIFLVCDMVLPSIRNTIHAIETFHELEYKDDKLKLIVNRFYDSDQVSLDEIARHVGLPIHWLIPYDSVAVISSLNAGQTVEVTDPNSHVSHSLMALARHTAGLAPKDRVKRKRGLFSWTR